MTITPWLNAPVALTIPGVASAYELLPRFISFNGELIDGVTYISGYQGKVEQAYQGYGFVLDPFGNLLGGGATPNLNATNPTILPGVDGGQFLAFGSAYANEFGDAFISTSGVAGSAETVYFTIFSQNADGSLSENTPVNLFGALTIPTPATTAPFGSWQHVRLASINNGAVAIAADSVNASNIEQIDLAIGSGNLSLAPQILTPYVDPAWVAGNAYSWSFGALSNSATSYALVDEERTGSGAAQIASVHLSTISSSGTVTSSWTKATSFSEIDYLGWQGNLTGTNMLLGLTGTTSSGYQHQLLFANDSTGATLSSLTESYSGTVTQAARLIGLGGTSPISGWVEYWVDSSGLTLEFVTADLSAQISVTSSYTIAGVNGAASVTTLGDGRVVADWQVLSGSVGSAGTTSTDYTDIFDFRTTGLNGTGVAIGNDIAGTPFNDTIDYKAGVYNINGGGGTDTFSATNFTSSQVYVSVNSQNNVVVSDGAGDSDTLIGFSSIILADSTIAISGTTLSQFFSGGGQTIALPDVVSSGAHLIDTAGNWDSINGSNGTIYFGDAQASVIGGGDTLYFDGSTANVASLYNSGSNWDTINGSNGTISLNAVTASVIGGGNAIYFQGSTDNVASLYNSGSNWDTISGSNGTVSLNAVTASVIGGGDTIYFQGSSDNVASLYNSGGNWDTISGSNGTVSLNAVTASVIGGGNTIYFQGSTGNVASLYNSGSNWDTVSGSNGVVSLNAVAASVIGGGDTIYFQGSTGNVASLYNSGSNWDTVSGSNGVVSLNAVTASVIGGGDTIYFQGSAGNVASLYNSGSNWDTINGSNGVVSLNAVTASVIGGGDTIYFQGATGNVASLYATNGVADQVNGSNGTASLNGVQANVQGDSNSLFFSGNNTATAQGANEAFVFQSAIGQNTINGFAASDTIQLTKSDFADWNTLLSHTAQSGSNTVITLDAADTITLTGVTASSLTSAEFKLV